MSKFGSPAWQEEQAARAKEMKSIQDLTGAIDPSKSAVDQMKEAYENYRKIVGQEDSSRVDLIECENCGDVYSAKENNDGACLWYARNHKGFYFTDYESDFWYGWHEANPPKKSSHWKEAGYAGQGGHKWTGCGCTSQGDECERQGRHRPKGFPPSDDDWEEEESRELSDDEFDANNMSRWNQDLLVSNYKLKLGYLIKEHQKEKGEKKK